MSGLSSDLSSNWHWLASEWELARQGWKDDTSAEFEAEWLDPLEDECSDITQVSEKLLSVLDWASSVALG